MMWVRLGWHNNLVLALNVEDIGGKPYLLMEYADGGDLRSWVKERRLTLPLAVNFARQFCEGMKYASARLGLVHRDIKPANVLVADNRIVKIADFGLARAFDPEGPAVVGSAPTVDGASSVAGAGTVAYMAPEQFRSLRLADTRSDVFSFGAMFFEMLTGRQLLAERDAYRRALFNERLPFAHEVDSRVPAAFSQVIARCLSYDPEERYPSFSALAEELADADSTLSEHIPLPEDRGRPSAAFFLPAVAIAAETYSLIALAQYEQAAQRAQEGIDLDPNSAEHWLNKGKALAESNDFVGAARCTEKATRLRPDDAKGWANLAWVTVRLGDAAAALQYALRAIRLDERLTDAWGARASCERALGRLEDAFLSLLRAAELSPHDWKAYANLGFCCNDMRRYDQAGQMLRRATQLNPDDPTVWYHLAWLLARDQRAAEARRAIDRSLMLDPTDADAWGLRAVISWEMEGDVVAARNAVTRALEIDPTSKRALAVLTALERGARG
jgi:tetratricopeptide (TPR) repeat protein